MKVMEETAVIRVAPAAKPSVISRELFGCNMELTRRTFWRGLSAQMLNNRKFFAHEEGRPCGWVLTGAVKQEDRPAADGGSGSRLVFRDGGAAWQEKLALAVRKGRRYQMAMTVTVRGRLTIRVTVGSVLAQTWELQDGGELQYLTAEKEAAADEAEPVFRIETAGTGEAQVFALSLMPTDHYHGCRRDVLQLLRVLAPAELRFPGGCLAEVYDWKEGLRPADRRHPIHTDLYDGDFLLRDTYQQDAFDMGIDEFMAVCAFVGAAPVLCVPLIIQPTETAADLVEYCNGSADTRWGGLRAWRGHPEPYGVRDWYIGNEVYYFGGRLAEDGAAAARATRERVEAMRRVDPSLRTIVGFCAHRPAWTEAYLPQVADVADRLSLHFYQTNEFDANYGKVTDRMRARVLEDAFLPELERAHWLAAELLPAPVPFSLDEWGYSWGERATAASALVDALLLSCLCAQADTHHIEKALYFHPVNEGMIRVEPDGASLDMAGEVFRLFAPHREASRLSAVSGDEALCPAASRRGRQVFVTVVNRDVQAARTFRLEAEGCVAGEWEMTQLLPAADGWRRETAAGAVGSEWTLAPGGVAAFAWKPHHPVA